MPLFYLHRIKVYTGIIDSVVNDTGYIIIFFNFPIFQIKNNLKLVLYLNSVLIFRYIVPGMGDAGDRIFGTTHN